MLSVSRKDLLILDLIAFLGSYPVNAYENRVGSSKKGSYHEWE